MTTKTKNIISWVLAGLVAFIFFGSGANKLMGGDAAVTMAKAMGLTTNNLSVLAIIEISAAILFLYPRTGILGTLLLVAYMGGAIATHLEHSQPILPPVLIASFLWIVAVIRFPELSKRLLNK
jgi:uncharacterized membrane protein YphA (DoxX/SURF4 family)